MTAVLTKKRSKARVPAAAESDELARYLAGHLSAALSISSEEEFQNWPVRDQLDRAACILGRVSDPDTFAPVSRTPDGDLSAMLLAAKEALDVEIVAIQRDAGMSLCGALHDGILARHVRDCLGELKDAYDSGQDGIAQLRRSATYDGAMGNVTASVVDITNGAAPDAGVARPEVDKDPSPILQHTVAVYWAFAVDACKNEAHGLHWMAEQAAEEVDAAIEAADYRRAEGASCILAQLVALSEIVIKADQDDEMPLLPAALTLLKQGKALLDDWIEEMARARRSA